jgi:hypothetical protein
MADLAEFSELKLNDTYKEDDRSNYFNQNISVPNGSKNKIMFIYFVREIAEKLFANAGNVEKEAYVNHILGELQQLFNKFKKQGTNVEDMDLLGFINIDSKMKAALEANSNKLAEISDELKNKFNLDVQSKWNKLLSRIGSIQFKMMVKNLRALKKSKQIKEQHDIVQNKQMQLEIQKKRIESLETTHEEAIKQKDTDFKAKLDEIETEQRKASTTQSAQLEQEKQELKIQHNAEKAQLETAHQQAVAAETKKLEEHKSEQEKATQALKDTTKKETEDFVIKMIDALNMQAGILESLYDKNIDETNSDYDNLKSVLKASVAPVIDRPSSVIQQQVIQPALEHYAHKKKDKTITKYTNELELTKDRTTEGYYKINGKWWPKQVNVDSSQVREFDAIPDVIDIYTKVSKPYKVGKGDQQKIIQAYYLKEGDNEKRKYLKDDDNWEAKYLKYKEKYLALKNKLSN